jgi:hypothetical protein
VLEGRLAAALLPVVTAASACSFFVDFDRYSSRACDGGHCDAGACAPSVAAPAVFVSPTGSDSNPGTEAEPFRTLERARIQVQQVNTNMSSDFSVYLRGGAHALPATLMLGPRDSGSNGHSVIYTAYPGETPVVSGGQLITGWTAAGGGMYKANVGALRFRQVYVDGKRAIRAREPNLGAVHHTIGWNSATHSALISASEISSWARLDEVEMVNLNVVNGQVNLRVASFTISGTIATVVPQDPEGGTYFATGDNPQGITPYFFENALELLDSPGEWYLHTGTGELYYMPRPGEDLSTSAVVVPVLDALVSIQGTLDSPVHDIEFLGITFAHSNWTGPSTQGLIMNGPVVVSGAGRLCPVVTSTATACLGSVPPAVSIENANHLRFEGNAFEDLGGAALGFWSGTHDDTIVNNSFRDLAGGGIAIDIRARPNPTDPRSISSNETIIDNFFTRVGQDYRGTYAIWGGFLDSVVIRHNELVELPFTGISLGSELDVSPTAARNNLVQANRIHGVVNQLSNGGAIYMIGAQPGSRIEANYVYELIKSSVADQRGSLFGLYFDCGCSGLSIVDDVADSTPAFGMRLQSATHNSITDFVGTISDNSPGMNTYSNDGRIDQAAIEAAAGIEPQYSGVVDGGSGCATR